MRDLPAIPKELIDQFVDGPMSAEAIQGASMAFKEVLIERALGAELAHHLGCLEGAGGANNQRNGRSGKTVLTDDGPLRLDIPRDRDGSFAPILIPCRVGFMERIQSICDPIRRLFHQANLVK